MLATSITTTSNSLKKYLSFLKQSYWQYLIYEFYVSDHWYIIYICIYIIDKELNRSHSNYVLALLWYKTHPVRMIRLLLWNDFSGYIFSLLLLLLQLLWLILLRWWQWSCSRICVTLWRFEICVRRIIPFLHFGRTKKHVKEKGKYCNCCCHSKQ